MSENLDVTQEMLEQALLCCANDNPAPAGTDPCADCYLMQKNLVKDGHVSTGETCFMHLTLDVISYIRRINIAKYSGHLTIDIFIHCNLSFNKIIKGDNQCLTSLWIAFGPCLQPFV